MKPSSPSLLWIVSYSLTFIVSFGQNVTENKRLSESDYLNSLNSISEIHAEKPVLDCSTSYAPECFQSSFTRLLDKLEHGSDLQLLPGVSLVWPPQQDIHNSSYDKVLWRKMSDYLKTVSIRIQLFNPQTLSVFHSIQDKIVNSVHTAIEARKKKDGGGILLMGLMMGGSMLLLGLTALGVLAGKALMVGVLAFFFSAITGLASLKGDDAKATTYEVLSRPVVSHGHSHSSEVQYEHSNNHGHHGYKRSIEPLLNQFAPRELQMAFKGYRKT